MSSMTRVDSTNQAVYTITDNGGSTLTVTVSIDPIVGNKFTFASSGTLAPDGLAMLAPIIYPLITGIVPQSPTPSF